MAARIPHTRNAAFAYLEEYGPATSHKIAEQIGIKERNVFYAMRRARNLRLCHIKTYVRNEEFKVRKADWIPVWILGPGRDAQKPPPYTGKEISALYYQRNKAKIALKVALKYRRRKNQHVGIGTNWIHALLKR